MRKSSVRSLICLCRTDFLCKKDILRNFIISNFSFTFLSALPERNQRGNQRKGEVAVPPLSFGIQTPSLCLCKHSDQASLRYPPSARFGRLGFLDHFFCNHSILSHFFTSNIPKMRMCMSIFVEMFARASPCNQYPENASVGAAFLLK